MSPEKEIIFEGASPAVDKLARIAGVDKLFDGIATTCVSMNDCRNAPPSLKPNQVTVISAIEDGITTFMLECSNVSVNGHATATKLGKYSLALLPLENGRMGVVNGRGQCLEMITSNPHTIILPLLATGLPKV